MTPVTMKKLPRPLTITAIIMAITLIVALFTKGRLAGVDLLGMFLLEWAGLAIIMGGYFFVGWLSEARKFARKRKRLKWHGFALGVVLHLGVLCVMLSVAGYGGWILLREACRRLF